MPNFVALPERHFDPKVYRPGNLGTWSGHLPFANDLVWSKRPGLLVELGTHYGESYFAFCQAVKESGAETRCVAVDTWKGDEHAGFYGEEVYQQVEAYNRAEYQRFSTLLRTTFDEASEQFEPESIDVLHVDGLHTYDAVKHDFETWFPKVKPGGTVLMHDINVHHANFQVWRLWEELSREFPHFEFRHSWGLGILAKTGGEDPECDLLSLLFDADQATAERIRRQYSDAAELLDFRQRRPDRTQAAAEMNRPYLQVFPGMLDAGFEEKTSVLSNVEAGVWQRHVLDLPQGASNGWVRIDPLNRVALLELLEIVVRIPDGEPLIEIKTKEDFSNLYCCGDLMACPSGKGGWFFSWGNDPQFIVGLGPTTSPLRLEITMRVQFSLKPLAELLRLSQSRPSSPETASDSEDVRIAAADSILKRSRRFFKKVLLHGDHEPNGTEAGLRPEKVAELESFVERAIDKGKIAGAVLLIARNGKLASHRALGWLDREARRPMRLDALFYVLSMTKALTCAALLSLVDEGKISLNDPVERWLPEFRGIRFSDGRKPEELPLIWQCMAHSSGLLDAFPESFLKSRFTLPEFVSVGARNPLGYEPGHGWAYCNLGIAVVGRIIEIVSATAYQEILEARIFRPIGMKSSFFRVPKEHSNRLAAIYRITDGGLLRDNVTPYENAPDYVAPENGLRTTALDFWKFYEMIRSGGMANGKRILSDTSARSMITIQTGDRNAGFLPGMGYGYGLSLVTEPTGMFRNHSAGTFGHGSYYQEHAWVDPVKGISGLLFSHNRVDPLVVTPEIEQFLPMVGALD